MYSVAWAGFDEKANSWEPETNLDNAVRLVKEYYAQRKLTTNLKYRTGASEADRSNPKNWIELDKVAQFVIKWTEWKSGYIKNPTITFEPDEANLNDICIFSFSEHAHVTCKRNGVMYLADGANKSAEDNGVKEYLQELTKHNVKTIEYSPETIIDECAISATLITLEFLKITNLKEMPKRIYTPSQLSKHLIESWTNEHKLINQEKPLNEYRKEARCEHRNKRFSGPKYILKIKTHQRSCPRRRAGCYGEGPCPSLPLL